MDDTRPNEMAASTDSRKRVNPMGTSKEREEFMMVVGWYSMAQVRDEVLGGPRRREGV